MSELSIFSTDFQEGGEIPKICGYKHGNEEPPPSVLPYSSQ